MISANGALGTLDWVKNKKPFIIISTCAQVVAGMSNGMINTGSMAIISSFPSAERDKFVGMQEGSSGFGLLIGPVTGGILYHIGGFCLPFWFFSCFLLVLTPFIWYTLL